MAEPIAPPASPVAAAQPAASPVAWRQILRVAWLSIGLGLLLELVLVLYAVSTGHAQKPQPFITDLVQKVSWGFIVCLGIAFGTTASQAREAKAGLLGLISAPVGFTVARALHKGLAEALGVAVPAMAVSPFLIGGLKGLQYALFGAALAWIGKQTWGRLGAHAGAGLLFGLTFGVTIFLILEVAATTPTPPVGFVSRILNELIFPTGCAVVVYATKVMGKRLPG